VAAEYEVNIKINSRQIERELKNIDKIVSNIGKPKGGGSRKKPGIAGLLPSSAELKAAERGLVQLNAKTKAVQSLQDKFSERKVRSLIRSNALNEKELRLNKQLTAEARARLRLLSQAGAKGFDGTRPQGRQLANDINARAKAQDKRARLLNKINEMEAKGLNVEKLRKQLNKATTEQSARRFANADKEFNILRKTIELEKSKLRILKEQRRNFLSSPIRGTSTMMGSPAQIAASGRQIASPIRGGLNFPGSPGFLAGATASRTPFGPSFPTGGAALPVKGSISIPGSPIAVQAAKKTNLRALKVEFSWLKAFEQLQETAAIIAQNAQKARQTFLAGQTVSNTPFGPGFPTGGAASPVGGGLNFPGSPIANAEANRIARLNAGLTGQTSPIRGGIFQKGSPNQKRFEGVALGAGFPALFGGGPGSIIGGGLGGLTGSFGAQIGLSAIGQQVDAFIASVARVGTALTSATGTVEMFREKNLFSSDAVKEHAFQLEEQGKMQELATLLTKDLASQIGKNAVENFQALGGELKEFFGIVNQLFLSVQGFVAGPLAKFLSAINTVLGGVSTDVKFGSLRGSLTGDAAAQFEAIVAETRGSKVLTGPDRQRALRKGEPLIKEGILSTKVKEAILKDPRIAKLRQTIDVTGQTTIDDTLGSKTGKKAARDAEQLQKRLDKLEAERQKVLDISRFRDKIAAANAAEDQQLVIRLNGEQKIVEIEAKRKKDLAGITKQREKDAINIGAATKKLAVQRDTERELNELQRKRQEKFQDTIEGLDHQLALARATTEEERERLRIEEKIRKLREDDKLSDPQLAAVKSRMEALAEENNLINTFIRETQAQIEKLNNPMFQAIELANTLGNAFSQSFRGIIDGSMSAQQALANLFQRTADHFLDMAAQMIAAQIRMQAVKLFMSFGAPIFGGGAPASKYGSAANLAGPGGDFGLGSGPSFADPKLFAPPTLMAAKALGGPVSRNQPYLVGERGPEMFVPGAQGNIVPNNAMGGGASVTVNVDASGSSVEGDGNQAAQLGKAIGIAVQQELIKQKRPGGLLTR